MQLNPATRSRCNVLRDEKKEIARFFRARATLLSFFSVSWRRRAITRRGPSQGSRPTTTEPASQPSIAAARHGLHQEMERVSGAEYCALRSFADQGACAASLLAYPHTSGMLSLGSLVLTCAVGQARYVVKVRPSDQWLVLKVTDDVKVSVTRMRAVVRDCRMARWTRGWRKTCEALPGEEEQERR